MNFEDFFRVATGYNQGPFDYQRRLAEGQARCQSLLLNVPTGLGKTAAVTLAWLWNRVALRQSGWPLRLAYCLPMRTLVEQTANEIQKWIARLAANTRELGLDAPANADLHWLLTHSPVVLMGGEDLEAAKAEWDIYPEKPCLLVGTQDMLLSRALNRGYGMSRYRWPMHFGLLNSDCLWVLDETQLMGVGVETSAQLDGFRHLAQWANAKNCPTWWMSATLDEARLATVDGRRPAGPIPKIELSPKERAADGVRQRFEAKKPVAKAEFILSPATKEDHAKNLADLIKQKHVPGTLTLVVVNRVSRARKLYVALRDKKLGLDPSHIALIHSRFRPSDRARHTKLLFSTGDRIVVATQAVEAGVDVSARLLITELAPWSSLVQRLGRSNRLGNMSDAEVIWIDIQASEGDLLLPYSVDDLEKSRQAITGLTDAGPHSLSGVHVPAAFVIRPVIRRRDLIDLFDTTPDLCGQDLDISRYIRDGDDSDVQLFWRDIGEGGPPADEKPPCREELCRVSIADARKFIEKQSTRVWQWNSLEEEWEAVKRIRPGGVYLVRAGSGGYDDDLGWSGDPKHQPTPCPAGAADDQSYRKDPQTFARYWLALDQHAQNVMLSAAALAQALSLDPPLAGIFRNAAQWHDVGKAHPAFQAMLRGDDTARLGTLWAKSAHTEGTCERRGFRHELASALAWLSAAPRDAVERDLTAYLIAAHHGKVRLSIRALPDETGDPQNPDGLFARGVWHKDELPAVPGATSQPVALDLRLMQMGETEQGPSWLARAIALRDRLGPFRLAYLETILRAADMRASREEAGRLIEAGSAARHQLAEKRKET